MATKGRTTQSKLTLDISGPEISAVKFANGVRAFLDILQEVTRDVAGNARTIEWLVSVRPGSIVVDYVPRGVDTPSSVVESVVDTVENGIMAAEEGTARPACFSEAAMEKVARLASIVNGGGPKLDKVVVWRDEQPHQITLNAVANVDARRGIASRDWGTIEGVLEMVSGVRGFLFKVRDGITDKQVACNFTDELVEEVTGAFMKRVSVSGMIRYRSDGEAVSIDVEEVTVFPDPASLPSANDVRGILRGVV